MQLITHRYLLFVCLFVWGFSSHSRIFHSYRDVTITGEGLNILTYASSYQLWYITSILYVVRRYMAEILPIRRKALYIINQSISYVDVKSHFNRDMSHLDWINSNINIATLNTSDCCVDTCLHVEGQIYATLRKSLDH